MLDGPFGQKLAAKLQEKDLVGLVYWENGFRNLTNTKRPVAKMEDMQGVKLRVMQNPVYIDMFNSFGANAVPLPFSELSPRWKPRPWTARKTRSTRSSRASSTKCRSTCPSPSTSTALDRPGQQEVVGWLVGRREEGAQESAVASRDFERKDSRDAAGKAIDS